MKFFKTTEFFDDDIHTKRYYFCGMRYLKKTWIGFQRETYCFSLKTSGRKKIKYAPDENGITIVEVGGICGESKIGRSAIESLNASNIRFDTCLLQDLYTKYLPKYRKQLVFSTFNFIKHPVYSAIPVLLWEFDNGMPLARPYAFENISGIVTFSTFCAKYFRKIAPRNLPIYVLPYPIDIDVTKLDAAADVRNKYGIKPDDFVFFFNFSYLSSYFRKNPEGVLDAFVLAFPARDKNIKLVIKTVGFDSAPDLAKRLLEKIQALGLQDNVILIEQDLTDYGVYSLINSSDAYVSLHRGEGLGLGMMEAMYLGCPVIATNYGGNTDFTKQDNSLLVDYQMVAPQEVDLEAYNFVKKWPEPNIKTAAKHMVDLYKDPALRSRIGLAGQAFIKQNFNKNAFNDKIRELLI